jgi:uncharacterized protein (TIGR02246 family)
MTADRSDGPITRQVLLITVAATVLAGCSQWLGQAWGQVDAKSAASAKSQPTAGGTKDQADIRAVMDSIIKAFVSRDAKALAGHWTSEGEYRNQDGIMVHGREALENGFTEFFTKTPDLEAQVQPDSLRFVSDSSAIEEGVVTVRRGAADAATRAHYTALFVREDGQWRLAQLSESPAGETTIADLAWLIGEWKSTSGDGAEIRATYSWDANKKFIHVRFAIQEKTIGFDGTQVIGVDPATGTIRSWTFEATGGVGEADWERDGDHWVLEAVGTLPDGGTLVETNVLRRVDEDTITWQSVDRLLDDVVVPDLAPVKLTRVKPEP